MIRLVLAALVAAAPMLVEAQAPMCGAYEHITSELTRRYGEVLRARMVNTLRTTEVWANGDSQTWTIITRNVQGVTCIRAAGQGVEWFGEPREKA